MAEKLFTNVRLGLKVDSLEAWQKSTLILKKGEVAFATTAASAGTGLTEPVVMMKIGDGDHTFSQLEWNFYARSSDVLAACKSEASLKAFVNGVIADAGIASDEAMQELAGKVTVAEGKITTLEGKMTTAEGKISANEQAIEAIEGRFGAETVAAEIATAIANLKLGETYAPISHKHEIADVNGLADSIAAAKKAGTDANAALEAYKILNDAAVKVNSDAIAGIKNGEAIDNFKEVEEALAGKQAVGDYATKAEAQGYANAKDSAIAEAKKAGTDAAAQALVDAKAYADGLAKDYDAAGDAAQALVDAKAYTDAEIAEWVGDKTVGVQIENAITGLDLANTYDAKGAAAAAESAAKAHATGLNTAMNTRVEALEAIDHSHTFVESELNLIKAGDVAKWNAAEQNAKDYADGLDEAMDARVLILEAKFGDGEGNVEDQIEAAVAAEAKLRGDADTALSNRIKAVEDDYLKQEDADALSEAIGDVADELERLTGGETVASAVKAETDRATAAEEALGGRITAIANDYLKAADKTELQGNIDTVSAAVERLTNGVSADEVDGVNDLINYVKEHGTEVTGMKKDISDNAAAIDAIEKDYLKAADKTELAGQISGLDTRLTAAEGAVATKAEQADLNKLDGRVEAVEGDLNTATTGIKARMTAAEADIDALETKVGDKTVAAQIEAAIEALKIGDYAKAAALTEAVGRIAQNETDISDLKGRMGTAEGEIDGLQTEVAKKANDADLAAIAKSGNVNDLVQTAGDYILFDCGGAE